MDAKERSFKSMIDHWWSVCHEALENEDYDLVYDTMMTIEKAKRKYEKVMGKPYAEEN